MKAKTLFMFVCGALLAALPSLAHGQDSGCESKTKAAIKNIVFLGDSNTWLGGDGCNQPKGWTKWFCERLRPATKRSYARSGATWTNTPETKYNVTENIGCIGNDNVIFNQINRLNEACADKRQARPDLILILAGTNDVWFMEKRPKVFDKTAEAAFESAGASGPAEAQTLADAVRLGCEMLRDSFPEAQIVLLTPFQSVATRDTDISTAGDIMEDCGRRMDIRVIRLDKLTKIRSKEEAKARRYTYDGTHTGKEGARHAGNIVADCMTQKNR